MAFGSLPRDHLSRHEPSIRSPRTAPSYGRDSLKVFQAAPLVHIDTSGRYHPVRLLDFAEERQILMDTLGDLRTKIDVSFDVANSERLGAFLATGEGHVLHFSCHGHPQYLAIENNGMMQQLLVEDLRDWIHAGGQNLKLVFVSACCSRQAGEAFIEAGVPHVVCCQQDDQQIRNAAAVEFARAFYRALACGKMLSEAFELGRQQVLNSLQIDRVERQKEVAKFTLLPETGKDHNVPIFRHHSMCSNPQSSGRSLDVEHSVRFSDWSERHDRTLPVPPHVFEGRQVDMYRVLEALQSARLVRVTGSLGIGKCSVVQGLCRYMRDRRHPFAGEVLWLPAPRTDSDSFGERDNELHRLQTEMGSLFSVAECPRHQRTCEQVLTYLHTRRALVVIDVRKIKDDKPMNRVCAFLEDLVQCTEYAKAIVIHHLGDPVAVTRFNCVESNVHIKPLDFESTVILFGTLCQHVTTRRYEAVSDAYGLCNMLIPDGTVTSKPLTKKSSDIFKMMGEGVPAKIQEAAKTMTEEQYDRLISLASRKEHQLEFKSRAALDHRLSELTTQLDSAIEEKNFMQAQEYQEQPDETKPPREDLPDQSLQEFVSVVAMAEQMVQETISNVAVEATKVEVEGPTKKSKSKKKLMSLLRRRVGRVRGPSIKRKDHGTM